MQESAERAMRHVSVPHRAKCSIRGLSPRPMAHRTIALTTERVEPCLRWTCVLNTAKNCQLWPGLRASARFLAAPHLPILSLPLSGADVGAPKAAPRTPLWAENATTASTLLPAVAAPAHASCMHRLEQWPGCTSIKKGRRKKTNWARPPRAPPQQENEARPTDTTLVGATAGWCGRAPPSWTWRQKKLVPDVLSKILVMPALTTFCPSGLRRWAQVPLVQTSRVASSPAGVISGSSLNKGAPANCWPTERRAWPGAWALTRLLGWGKGHQRPSSLVTAYSEFDTEGIRAPAGRARWISSPTP